MNLRSLRNLRVFCLILVAAGCGQQSRPPVVEVPIMVSVSPQNTAIATGQSTQITVLTNDTTGVSWTASAGSIDAGGNYTAPAGPQSATATVTATSKKDPTKSASATVNVVAPGQVSGTANALVALYTISPAAAGNVSVQFGTDTNYGLTTWTQPVPTGGGAVSLFVAGMKANTLYHIKGLVAFGDGTQFMDADQTFTTGTIPPGSPQFSVTSAPGIAPQSGVEMVNTLTSGVLQATASDLAGNIIWYYSFTGAGSAFVQPIRQMANGDFLLVLSPTSTVGSGISNQPSGTISVVREIDLAGNTVKEISIGDLNTKMIAAGYYNLPLGVFHHDVIPLSNGHWIVLTNTSREYTNLPGFPGTTTNVLGDVLVDLDSNLNPVWVWNEFDHLDVNRHPMQFPDWTHSNAVIYSADDGNLLVSVRHQNWLLKVDYENGKGDGHILWHLGYQGDFTLVGGTDPTDWFYAQHGPSFASTNTTGQFSLTVFDNGDDRVFPAGVTCGTSGAPPCLYSTAQVLQLDETAKTATLSFHQSPAPAYSFFGGNSAVLKNGNVEYCESIGGPGGSGDIYEVTQDSSAQVIWHMVITNLPTYRGQRLPSLYPGIQW